MSVFDALNAQYGDDDEAAFDDPKDPLVTVGRKLVPIEQGEDYHYVAARPPDAYEPDRTSLSKALLGLYRMEGPSLRQLQERLYAGGFYGVDRRNIRFGVQDEYTADAYKTALMRTAQFNASGDPNKTVDDVINSSSASGPAEPAIMFSDPKTIKALVQNMAPKLLGAKATDATVEAIVRGVHEYEALAAATRGGGGSSPNEAWYAAQIESLEPSHAQSYEALQGMSTILKTLSNPNGDFSG